MTGVIPSRRIMSQCGLLSWGEYLIWGLADTLCGAGKHSIHRGHETWARNKPLLLKAWGLGLLLKHDSTILTQTQCSGLSNNKFSFEQWDILDILFIGFEESSGWCFLWHIHAPWCYLSDLSSSPIALESSFQITLVLDDVFFLTLLFLTLFSL